MAKYIDADELLKLLNVCKYPVNKTTMREMTYNSAINDARRCVDAIPAADVVEVRHGSWIMHIDDLFPEESTMECNQCHEEQPLECDDKYCPNCGASMVNEDE